MSSDEAQRPNAPGEEDSAAASPTAAGSLRPGAGPESSPEQGEPLSRQVRNLDTTIRRRNSREWAVQMLFALDFAPTDGTLEDFFADFWQQQQDVVALLSVDPETALRRFECEAAKPHRAFAESLVEGVRRNQDEIDARITAVMDGGDWTFDRLGGVDRNVLRLAFHELFFLKGTPPAVVINEAVDVAKYFSTRESGRLVNGVLIRAVHAAGLPVHYQAEDPGFPKRPRFCK